MYENKKYKILKIRDLPGERFECVVQWLEPIKKIEHIFMNDQYLDEELLIKRLDNKWERYYNKSDKQIKDKKKKIKNMSKKLVKEVD